MVVGLYQWAWKFDSTMSKLPAPTFVRELLAIIGLFLILVILGVALVCFGIVLSGCAAIVWEAVLFVSYVAVVCARWLAWRIVEYNKGPVLALSAVLTFVLGVALLFVKH